MATGNQAPEGSDPNRDAPLLNMPKLRALLRRSGATIGSGLMVASRLLLIATAAAISAGQNAYQTIQQRNRERAEMARRRSAAEAATPVQEPVTAVPDATEPAPAPRTRPQSSPTARPVPEGNMSGSRQRDSDLAIVSLGTALVAALLLSGYLPVALVGSAFGRNDLDPVMAFGLFVAAFGVASAMLCCIGVRAVSWIVTALSVFFILVDLIFYFAVFAMD